MIGHKLQEITITDTIQQAVNAYNVPGGWDLREKCVEDFKEEIKTKLLQNQGGKCAYCGLPLSDRNPEIDHIAPKGGAVRILHPECTFLPINLVYACHHCNSTSCKGQKNTVSSKKGDYRQWSFKLVHPYLDEPTDFFETSPVGTIMSLPKKELSLNDPRRVKAKYTIDMFGLVEESTLTELAKQIFLERNPDHINAIIKEISNYRP